MRESVQAVLKRGHTGRKVRIDEGYALAKRWADCRHPVTLRFHRAYYRFRREAVRAPRVTGGNLDAYRGRRASADIVGWECMGPPSRKQAVVGRYNRAGEPALYLCDSLHGVSAELGAQDAVCVQRYSLPVDSLRIADLADSELSSFVHAVMDFAEASGVGGRIGPASPTFSLLVASIVRACGFDGMRVPGVRGIPDLLYCNVVVFNPLEHWREWSVGEPGFPPQ